MGIQYLRRAAMDVLFKPLAGSWDELFHSPYTVALRGFPNMPTAQRAAIESRVAAEMEIQFGSAEGVKQAFFDDYRAFERHEATGDDPVAKSTHWNIALADAKARVKEAFQLAEEPHFWFSFYDDVYERPE
jgi:hypothetical protein